MSKTQITAGPGMPQIVITREFDAPPGLVFRAYTDPELLAQRLGPRDLTMTVERYDVRDGGRWRFLHAGATLVRTVSAFTSTADRAEPT